MKILVGLSGGLDSTYAAYFLKKNGHDVTGAAVIMHEYTDLRAARESAEAVGIPFVKIDARDAFQSKVVTKFVSEYCSARTPNPCVECNPGVKFAALCEYAEKNGFDKVATGHYSKVLFEDGRYYIRRAGSGKDQSYVLWKLTQKQLSMLYLPLSDMEKEVIRSEASKLGFRAAEAKDSQEICFIPDNDHAGFIERVTGKTFPKGNFVDPDGKPLGEHQGLIHYTVGQRKGLGIALGQPMFVKSLDPENNTVTLVPSGEEYQNEADISELSFMKLAPGDRVIDCEVRVRYSAKAVPCTVTVRGDSAHAVFRSPVRSVTPGQSAVFYDGNDILFGGVIVL